MTGAQAKHALERSTPYVTVGNLIAMCALVVTMLQAGILDVSAGGTEVASVVEVSKQVDQHSETIADINRTNDRQDSAIASVERRTNQRMGRVEEKIDQIYELLLQGRGSDNGRGST